MIEKWWKVRKTILYKHYVDHTYADTKRDESDKIFDTLNSYHPDIKLILEENQTNFWNTKITRENGDIETQVLCKNWKSLLHWQSKLTFCLKENALTEELHRAKWF